MGGIIEKVATRHKLVTESGLGLSPYEGYPQVDNLPHTKKASPPTLMHGKMPFFCRELT